MDHPPISEQVTFLYTPDPEAPSRFRREVVGLEMVRARNSAT